MERMKFRSSLVMYKYFDLVGLFAKNGKASVIQWSNDAGVREEGVERVDNQL